MKSADAKAQTLLALLGELSQDSDRASMITRFMDVFREIWPGTLGHFTQDACAESPECFPVEAGESQFGCLVLDALHELSEEELALIRHALSLLGLILNTQDQQTRLTDHKQMWEFENDAEKVGHQSIETRLRESQAHLAAIFNHTRDLQLLARYEGPQRFRIVEINHAYIQTCNQYGLELTAADFIGRSLEDVILHTLGLDEKIAEDTLNNYQQAIDTGDAVRYDECFVVSGKPYHSSITLSPIQKAEGNQHYVVYSSHDVTTQKEAEAEILRLKSFFENVTENVQDGIWVTDKDDVIFYVNRGMERIAGVPKEQIVGNNVLENFPKATTEQFNVFYRQAKHDLTPTWYEVTVRTPAGVDTWQNGWLVPLVKDGRFDGIICTIRDVTERKNAERELAHSEARYKQLVETASDAIYLIDERGIIVDANRMASRILQKSREEIVGSPIDTVDPNFPVDAFLAFWNTVPYGEQRIFETTHITKQGDLIPIEISGEKFHIDEQTYYFGVARNISDRKRSEKTLKRQRDFFELVINSAPTRIFWKDRKCVYLGCNSAFATDVGLESPEELIGKSDDDLVWKANAETYRADDQAVMRSGQPKLQYEEAFLNRAGERVVWRTSKIPLQNADGDIIGVVAASENITKEKLAAEKLQASEAKFRSYIDYAPDGIFVADEGGRYLEVNPAACAITGYSQQELVRMSIPDLLSKGDLNKGIAHLKKTRDTGAAQEELGFVTKSGEARFWQVAAVKISDTRFLGFTKDITERKHAVEKLHASEEQYRFLAENTSDLIILFDGAGGFKYISPNVQELSGYSPEEYMAFETFENIYPEDRPLVERNLKNIAGGAEKTTVECRIFHKSGRLIWIQTRSRVIHDRDGNIESIISTSNDVTERKNAEEALRKSEVKFRALFEQAGGYCMILDPNTESGIPTIVDANQAALDSHGYRREEFIGRPVADIDDDDGKNMVIERTRMIMSGKPFYVENRHVRQDGSTFPVAVNAKRIDIEGEPPLIFTIEYDISQRKAAEEKLKENEEKLRLAIDNSPLGICMNDMQGNFMSTNRAYEKLIGYSEEDLKKCSFLEITHPEDRHENRQLFEKMCSGKTAGFTVEKRNIRKDGRLVNVRIHSAAIHGSQGKPTFAMTFVEDVTERTQFVKTLEERNAYIEAIMDHMPIGFALNTIDDGDVKYMNNLFEGIYGWSREVLTNTAIFFEKVFPEPKFREKMRTQIVSDMQSGDPERMRWEDLKIVTSKGEVRYVYAFNIPLLEQNLMISTVQDVTTRKQTQDQLLDSLGEKETLLRELYHRTKNNMNVIQSMLMLQASFSRNAEVERIAKEVGDKIQAMALVHQKLYQSQNLSRIPLHDYLPELAELLRQSYSISPARITLELEIAPVFALIDTAIPCGLILNELMSNAFKHAFPNERSGEIQVRLTEDQQGLITLQLSDNGVGVPQGFDFRAQDSLGLQSIVMIAEHQLRGSVLFTVDHGVSCRVQFTDTSYQERV